MNEELFDELIASVREGGAILRGEVKLTFYALRITFTLGLSRKWGVK